jgi:LysM repeat protein
VTSVPTAIPPTAIVTTIPAATVIPSSACRDYYTVQPGDNLFRISLRYGLDYSVVARANQISDPRVIYSGQRLCIP